MARLKAIAVALAVALTSSMLVATAPLAVGAPKPVTDKKATITVTPTDQIKPGRVTVKFSKSHIVVNRPVQLQIHLSTGWTNVEGPVAMTASGGATISPSTLDEYASYRAVAAPYLGKVTVITRSAKSAVVTDKGARMTISPVAEGSTGSIKVNFAKAHRVKNRAVQLQIANSTEWKNVGKTVKMNSAGDVTFKTAPVLTATYRAVAAAYKGRVKAATLKAKSSWSLKKDYSFATGSPANADWRTWDPGLYTARKCAANLPNNVTMQDGFAKLRLTKTTSPDNVARAKAAGCVFSKTQKDTYGNSMVFTNGAFSLREGIVAAKVRFPTNTVMHGGIWLSNATGSPEIDIVESYGYQGRNSKYSKATSGIHQVMTKAEHDKLNAGKKKPWEMSYSPTQPPYVLSQTLVNVRKLPASWYKQDHVVSVEFTASKLIFRTDGKKTGELYRTTPQSDYYLVMSLITTPWELSQAKKAPKTTATMTVDWVRAWVQG